jgi:hypothetical protein
MYFVVLENKKNLTLKASLVTSILREECVSLHRAVEVPCIHNEDSDNGEGKGHTNNDLSSNSGGPSETDGSTVSDDTSSDGTSSTFGGEEADLGGRRGQK